VGAVEHRLCHYRRQPARHLGGGEQGAEVQIFVHYVGRPGSSDFAWTVSRSRHAEELTAGLPEDDPTRGYFTSSEFKNSFPNGRFNCWGIPDGAVGEFERIEVGDLILLVRSSGNSGHGIEHAGVVKLKAHDHSWTASDRLWPQWQGLRKFPWLFFFDTESGHLPWDAFLEDMGYSANFKGSLGLIQRIRPDRLHAVYGFQRT
jgi:hypothetical protein